MTKPTEQPKCCQTNESGGILANPEMIIKTIQSLISVINNNLEKLSESTKFLSCHRNSLVLKALEEIDIFEKTTLFDLQKAFE